MPLFALLQDNSAVLSMGLPAGAGGEHCWGRRTTETARRARVLISGEAGKPLKIAEYCQSVFLVGCKGLL